jgi:starvation-inducible DNA-binding protein
VTVNIDWINQRGFGIKPINAAQAQDNGKETIMADNTNTAITAIIKTVLADSFTLMGRTQGVHWNVKGSLFVGVHNLTEEQYTALFTAVDELAERLRARGVDAPFDYSELAAEGSLPARNQSREAQDQLADLAAGHTHIAQFIRDNIETIEEAGDPITADMLIGRATEHEKSAWMLNALAA